MNHNQRFHIDGFTQLEVSVPDELQKALTDLVNERPKEGFSLEQKYPGSLDLRPEAVSYPGVREFIEQNNLLERMEEMSGRKLALGTVQFRIASASQKTYLSWHRDTHFYSRKKIAGRIPPALKVIFYPLVNGESETTLKVIRGSHARVSKLRLLDLAQTVPVFGLRKNVLESNDLALAFNTQLFHAVAAVPTKPSPRLIISFE